MQPSRPKLAVRAAALASGAVLVAVCLPPREAVADPQLAPVRALRFVENRGAFGDEVGFVALGGPTAAWVTTDGVVLRVERRAEADPGPVSGAVVRLRFATDARELVAEGPLANSTHMLRGPDPARWAPHSRSFERVRMSGAWPGIDVVFHADERAGGALAYDLHVAPGADLAAAHVRVDGAASLRPAGDGGLVLTVPLGDGGEVELAQRAPVSWIEDDAGARPVRSRLRILDERTFGFDVEGWDGSSPLVVDPGFTWSTYLGGSASDSCLAVQAVPGRGIAIAGWAGSSDFPTTVGAFRTTGERDAFVAMLSEDGTRLLWSTYVGGRDSEEAEAIEVTPDGGIVVGGWTGSIDFPTTAGVYQPRFGFGSFLSQIGDGFVLRLSSDGSRLEWSTYIGRIGDDFVRALHVDADGSVIVAGETNGDAFPTTPGVVQPAFGSGSVLVPDAFVLRLAPRAAALVWSTYFGGFAQELVSDMRVASDGTIVIGGLTASQDFLATPGALQTTLRGRWDGYVTRLSADGTRVLFSTLIGGEGYDHVRAVALDAHGEIWLAGRTSTDLGPFPVTPDAYQTAFGAEEDGFVARLSADGTTLRAATLLGGLADDSCEAIELDGGGRVLVAGYTGGQGFPVGRGAAQPTYGGGIRDGFVAHFDPSLSFARAVSYAGGSEKDALVALSRLSGDEVVAVGTTFSADLPVAANAAQPVFGGGSDAVVLRVDLRPDALDSVVIEDPHAGLADGVFGGGVPVVLAAVGLWNPSAGDVDVESIDVLIAGAGGGAACVRDVSLFADLDLDGEVDTNEPRLSGPLAVVATDAVVRLPVGVRLRDGERTGILVVATTRDPCPAGAEVVAGVPGVTAVVARRATDGRRALVTGASGTQGRSWIRGERRVFTGDIDGDDSPTCRDVRRLAARLGDTATTPAEDPDGDGVVTELDVALLLARVVERPPAFVATLPGGARPGGLLAIDGYDLDGGVITGTLAGRAMVATLRNARTIAFVVPVDVPTGVRSLRVTRDGAVLVETDVEVR